MSFHRTVRHSFLPSKHNAYRPHLLGRDALLFFLFILLFTEGFFIASMLLQAPVGAQGAASWALGSTLVVLVGAILATLLAHVRVQPTELLLPAVLVSGIGAMFLFVNAHFFPPPVVQSGGVAQTAGEGYDF